jgi:hypothetical protein
MHYWQREFSGTHGRWGAHLADINLLRSAHLATAAQPPLAARKLLG